MNMKNWMQYKIKTAKIHQNKAFEEVNNLIIKERQGKKILLSDNKTVFTEFVSSSYLGLDQDLRLIKAISQDAEKFGVNFHSARTRIQPENNLSLDSLLEKIYFGGQPITFPTLHMAHLGFLPLLASGEVPSFPLAPKGVTFILDQTVHASIQINRGLLQQFGEVAVINFQNKDSLKQKFSEISKSWKTPIAIADSVGSMGGVSPVNELIELAEKYNGYIYLDDAHGTSVHGQHGCGYVLKVLNYQFHSRLILAATLGKAFGALGGVLLLPTPEDRDFTMRFAPAYIFGGPPALSMINASIASARIHLTDEIYFLQKKLWDNVNYFDTLLNKYIINVGTPSPIRGVYIGDEFEAIEFSKQLKSRGFILTTAMYPTVAKNQSILRASLSAAHSKDDIEKLCNTIKEIFQSKNWLNGKLVGGLHTSIKNY